MERLSILHLMNGFGDSSISWIVHRLIQQLGHADTCWHVSGLCGAGTMQEKFDQLGIKTVDFSCPVSNGSPARYEMLTSPRRRIRQYIIDHHIQIIHTHTPRTILQAALATIDLPQVLHLATKHLLTKPQDRRWGLPIAAFDRFSLYLPDHLVAVSQAMLEQILAQPGIPQCKVTAVRNAIPVDDFYVPEQRQGCRQELGLSPEMLALGFAGRFEKVKCIDLLLHAHQAVLSRYPQTRLVLIGEGSLQQEWQNLAEQLGIARAVIWPGFRSDMPRLLAALDIFVQPSVNEGLSLGTLEAMAAAKAVIATNVGGTSEVVVNNQTGVLVAPGSAQVLTAAILDLLDHPQKRLQLAAAGRQLVADQFNVQRMTGAYRQLYARLAGAFYPTPEISPISNQ